jgi:integrase
MNNNSIELRKSIEAYIESKKGAWSANTIRSETYRLKGIEGALLRSGLDNPKMFYEIMAPGMQAYSLRTMFIRAVALTEFMGIKVFREFFETNTQLFKYVYKTKYVAVTFEEAKKKILKEVTNEQVQRVALLMLTTGMRIHEAIKYDGSGQVEGKGGRIRPVFSKEASNAPGLGEHTIRRELAKVGLKPHDLRKLAATALAKAGFNEIDILYTMGWESMQTAVRYLQPQRDGELARRVKKVLGGN